MDLFVPDWLQIEWDGSSLGEIPESVLRPLREEKRSEVVQNALVAFN